MRLAYRLVATNHQLDTVTITGNRITYDTGRAKQLFQSKIDAIGRTAAIATLTNWSNGYVSVTPIE